MKHDISKKVFTTLCQKCGAKPTKAPLAELITIAGGLFVPDILYCVECGAQLTIQVRELTKDELKKREEEINDGAEGALDAETKTEG